MLVVLCQGVFTGFQNAFQLCGRQLQYAGFNQVRKLVIFHQYATLIELVVGASRQADRQSMKSDRIAAVSSEPDGRRSRRDIPHCCTAICAKQACARSWSSAPERTIEARLTSFASLDVARIDMYVNRTPIRFGPENMFGGQQSCVDQPSIDK